VIECDREGAVTARRESLVFTEVFGEIATRASVCNAIRRGMILLRLT
jgi:hypothetical protein